MTARISLIQQNRAVIEGVNEFPTTFAAAAFPSSVRRGMAFERHSSSFIHTFIERAYNRKPRVLHVRQHALKPATAFFEAPHRKMLNLNAVRSTRIT